MCSSVFTDWRSHATAREAGIGMAIVKQLLASSGGPVGVESHAGSTHFWFGVPGLIFQAPVPL